MSVQIYSCSRCGKEFQRYACHARGKRLFCSKACSNFKEGEDRACPTCGKVFYAQRGQIKAGNYTYCSKACSNPAKGRAGASNGNWKGGRFVRSDGYVAVHIEGGKYRLEHDLVMRLDKGENVHHLNEVRTDNRLENLKLTTVSEHIKEHHPSKKDLSKWAAVACQNCGKVYAERTSKLARHPNCFCTRGCYVAAMRKGGKPC